MTHVARLGGGNMRRAFIDGDGAVVAVLTQVSGLSMIKGHYKRLPSGAGGMTGFARICGHRMCSGFVGGIGTGMTGCASVGGLIVRERRH